MSVHKRLHTDIFLATQKENFSQKRISVVNAMLLNSVQFLETSMEAAGIKKP